MHEHYYTTLNKLMLERYNNAKIPIGKQRIVDHFVRQLRNDGLTDEKIIKIAQANDKMHSNSKAYIEAVKKALGTKRHFGKKTPKALGKKK